MDQVATSSEDLKESPKEIGGRRTRGWRPRHLIILIGGMRGIGCLKGGRSIWDWSFYTGRSIKRIGVSTGMIHELWELMHNLSVGPLNPKVWMMVESILGTSLSVVKLSMIVLGVVESRGSSQDENRSIHEPKDVGKMFLVCQTSHHQASCINEPCCYRCKKSGHISTNCPESIGCLLTLAKSYQICHL